MNTFQTTAGHFVGSERRIAIVAARFNDRLVERLLSGATDALLRHGVHSDSIHVARVPGAFEIPVVAKAMIEQAHWDGVIALGVVVRGETPHFDYVCSTACQGCAQLALDSGLPVGLGILTCDSSEQAAERCGGKHGNKGAEAALSVLETIDLLQRLRGQAD